MAELDLELPFLYTDKARPITSNQIIAFLFKSHASVKQ